MVATDKMELWLNFLLEENLIYFCVYGVFISQISHAVHFGIQVHSVLVNSALTNSDHSVLVNSALTNSDATV